MHFDFVYFLGIVACPVNLVIFWMININCVIQELKFDPENAVYTLDALPKSVDVGKYTFVFEVSLFSLMCKGYISSVFTSLDDKHNFFADGAS